MSVKGLQESEKLANSLQNKLKATLSAQQKELAAEIKKLEYILADKATLNTWKSDLASAERLASLIASMNETELLYLNAGETAAAKIFKQRMEKYFKQRLTNLKANQMEVEIKSAQYKLSAKQNILQGLNTVKNEGTLREMYDQSRKAGGFLSNFGKAYLPDLITLETKAAGSKTLGEYMSNLFNTYETGLKDVFVKGIVRGDSYSQMIANLQKKTNITAGKAKLLVNTEANAIFNESVREVINNNPLVKGYRFRAVLDSKTSKVCQQHDGEYIPKDQVKPGVNYPPLHPNCRSTVTTVLYNENERLDTVQRYTKNGANQWEKVPVGITYQEYKDKFGFSNSKNPKTYNPATRDINDKTLARITPNVYKGYVKPSASSTARIDKMLDAYINNDTDYLDAVKQNTKQTSASKAIFRQAQAEAGFDGLPLQLDAKTFDEQVKKNNYKTVYRQFSKQEYLDEFLTGEQPFGSGQANYGPGTYTFSEPPTDNAYGPLTKTIALKSDSTKILKFSETSYDSQMDIASALTPDNRINAALLRVPANKRRELLSTLAVQYGYDAIEVKNQSRGNYTVILNRTAAIVRGD